MCGIGIFKKMHVLKDRIVECNLQNLTEHILISTFPLHIISHIKYTYIHSNVYINEIF